jgi:hypothetical protein
MRSRFFSTTVEPAAVAPRPPPNMSDRPPPFPLCSSTRKMRAPEMRTWRMIVKTNMRRTG